MMFLTTIHMELRLKDDRHIPPGKQTQMKQEQYQGQCILYKKLFRNASNSSEDDLGKGEIREKYVISKLHLNSSKEASGKEKSKWKSTDLNRKNEILDLSTRHEKEVSITKL